MKLIITGVAGFIGSNLTKKILDLGHNVIGIDNLSYGNLKNMESFINNKNFKFVFGDLTNPLLLKDYHGDIIIHLASQKIPRYTNALKTLEENNLMLKNIIQKCIIDKSKIVFSSTSDVYGNNPDIPFSEKHNFVIGTSTVKRWAYATSKIFSEQYIIANHDEYGIDYTITRFFGSYGPNQNLTWWGGPQSLFIEKALKNEIIDVHGNGLQTRTFTYIEDTINALIHCIFDEKAKNEIFNTGSKPEEEITIIGLAELIWKLINGDDSKPKIKLIPYETFGNYQDVMRRVPDITKLKEFFNFEPSYTLKNGLLLTIDWQKNISK